MTDRTRPSSAAAFALLLAAGAAPAAAADGCSASASHAWKKAGVEISAQTFGPDCARAVAVFVMRDAAGLPVYQRALPANGVMLLADAADAAAMTKALGEWITPAGPETTAALPEWKAGADAPEQGEFPFYPAEGNDAQYINDWRAAAAPMFCYVQGMESAACLAIEDGTVSELGVQAFPG